jgi:hypothetical protein
MSRILAVDSYAANLTDDPGRSALFREDQLCLANLDLIWLRDLAMIK